MNTVLVQKADKYRLPFTTTPEELECRGYMAVNYGSRVLVVGHYWMGPGQNSRYGAVYERITDDRHPDSEIRLMAISEEMFEDEGTALEWGIRVK